VKSKSSKFQHMLKGLKRNQNTRDVSPRFFICCEDSKAAPRYFEDLRIDRKLSRQSVVIDTKKHGSDPGNVVERAIKFRNERNRNGDYSEEDKDQVWAVIDVDQHENIENAIQNAQSKGIHLAISNPCFEYWILLHFEDTAAYVTNCDELISKHLKKHLPHYDKGKTGFSEFVVRADVAAQRAQKQFKAKAEPDPVKCCPCTMIYKLINELNKSK